MLSPFSPREREEAMWFIILLTHLAIDMVGPVEATKNDAARIDAYNRGKNPGNQ